MNDRQEKTLAILKEHAVGRENKVNKKFIALMLYGEYYDSQNFYKSIENRKMADDFRTINEETEHVVVSTKGGVYLADRYEAHYVLERQIQAKGTEIQRLRFKQRKLNQDNQVKGDV